MGSNYLNPYVKCKFFKTADDSNRVTCKGPVEDSSLIFRFDNKDTKRNDLKIQMKTFCCDRYQNCEIYQMLRQIYEEE